ncbi:glycosyltransferase [Prochlorococcus sp. AH-716-E13]|nr:glycosyltransferase [Prochlorococcus sp. AH-716-E13]
MQNKKSLKIIFIVNDPLFAHQHLYYIMNYLTISNNHEVCLLTSNLFNKDYRISPKVDFVRIDITRKPNLLKDLKTIFQIVFFIKNKRPDIIFSFTPKAGFLSIIASLFFKKFFHIHTFTGQLWSNSNGINSIFYRFLDSLIAKRSTLAMADSESQALFLNEKLYFSNSIVGLKGGSLSGVDHKKFKRKKTEFHSLNSNQIGIKYLFLGRVNLDKGINDLIKIIPTHLSIFKKDKFSIVGPCEDNKFLHELKKLKQKWPNNIFLNDFTNSPEDFLNDSDILLLPSRREGFGNTIIEAAACGVPTISYDIYGIKNSIIKNITGLLAKPFSIEEFSNLMKKCSKDKSLVNDLSIKAYSFSRKFNYKKRTKVFIDTILENTSLKDL